jgi:hypothetical protein
MRFMMLMIPGFYSGPTAVAEGDIVGVRQVFEISDFPADGRDSPPRCSR